MSLDKMLQAGLSLMASFIDDATGVILHQLGDVVANEVDSDKSESWQHVGFASRPAKAEPSSGACEVIAVKRSDHDMVIASRDLRDARMWSDLSEGGTVIYSVGPNGSRPARVAMKGDGSVRIEAGTNTVIIQPDGSVAIGAGATEYVALASLVQTALSTIQTSFDAHTHASAGGPTSLPVPLIGSVGPVAASKVKAV